MNVSVIYLECMAVNGEWMEILAETNCFMLTSQTPWVVKSNVKSISKSTCNLNYPFQ